MNLTNRTEVRAAIESAEDAEYVCLTSGYAPITLCKAPAKNVMGFCDDGSYPATQRESSVLTTYCSEST